MSDRDCIRRCDVDDALCECEVIIMHSGHDQKAVADVLLKLIELVREINRHTL